MRDVIARYEEHRVIVNAGRGGGGADAERGNVRGGRSGEHGASKLVLARANRQSSNMAIPNSTTRPKPAVHAAPGSMTVITCTMDQARSIHRRPAPVPPLLRPASCRARLGDCPRGSSGSVRLSTLLRCASVLEACALSTRNLKGKAMEKHNMNTQKENQEKDVAARVAKFKKQVRTGLRGGALADVACW